MSVARNEFSMCSMPDEKFVFVAGGWNDSGVLSSAERFNLQTKKWENMPKLAISRQSAGACALNGSVYVFCGAAANYNILN